MKFLLLLLFPSLISSTPSLNDNIYDFISAGVEYNSDLVEEVKSLKVKLSLPDLAMVHYNALGYCDSESKTLYLDIKFFSKNQFERQAIIDHELGHCLLGRIHRHQLMIYQSKKMPISVMYPESGLADYSKYKNKYRQELFEESRFYLLKYMKKKLNAIIEKEKIDKNTKSGDDSISEFLYAFEMYLNEDLDKEGDPKEISIEY